MGQVPIDDPARPTPTPPSPPPLGLVGKATLVVGAVVGATAIRALLEPVVGDRVLYVLYLAAVAAAARFGGWRAGGITTLASVIVASVLFAQPRGSLWPMHSGDRVAVFLFVAAALIITASIDAEQRARRTVEDRDARLRREISERQRLEAALIESQRLESIGRLAGGVAHDFNNLLTVVQGSLHLLKPSKEQAPMAENIELAARRGADLNKQLLGFARRQMLELQTLTLNAGVIESEKLLSRLLPEDILLRTELALDPWAFDGDPTQVQQVLMNLLTNARDALQSGGTISVETENSTLDEEFARAMPEVTPGEYVRLRVSDNGPGLSPEARARIFEPFYTTKEVGKGTGLGLAVVYGIVKQLRGHIFVDSSPGRGTTFDIYWPRQQKVVLGGPRHAPTHVVTPSLHILLVEDDELVRRTAKRLLEKLGHQVTDAANGADALVAAAQPGFKAELLLTDVVMPWMNGRELADRLLKDHDLAVVFMSGYTENVVLQKGVVKPGVVLLKKPFSMAELDAALSQALRRERAAAG
ncbi:MAG: response regulator [Myxococcales bacterium]|nr:response regulator [Myxococcales bacterium]